MNSAELPMNVNSSDTDMLLPVKEEPYTMADKFFTNADNSDNDDVVMSMMTVKEEPLVMDGNYEQPLMDTFDNRGGDDNGLDNPFCFETDHVALKNNKDYQHLLRAIILLESQRTTALKDLDTLLAMRKAAMAEPIQFVEKLQSHVDMGIPRVQRVAILPSISWDQYTADVDATLSNVTAARGGSAPLTRHKIKTLLNIKDDPEPSLEVSDSAVKPQSLEGIEVCSENGIRIRSRTFNQRWSIEEQKRFEQLLVKYPPERNQTKRHEKIARDLGTRTTVQVASHIQKYFKKLAEWKLPVPGPMPNITARRRRGGVGSRGRQRQRYCELFAPSSTFLASYELPVYMPEDEFEENTYPGSSYMRQNGDYSATSEARDESSDDAGLGDLDDELIPQHLKNSTEYLELKHLQNIKRDFEDFNSTVVSTNNNLICVVCREKLSGVSWRCVECPSGQPAVQFCSACSKTEYNTGFHESEHLLEKVDVNLVGAEAIDQDYSYSGAETYSYLDPNYRSKKSD